MSNHGHGTVETESEPYCNGHVIVTFSAKKGRSIVKVLCTRFRTVIVSLSVLSFLG